MKRYFLSGLLFLIVPLLHADNGRIYTQVDPSSTGGIEGAFPVPVTHAIAVDRERVHVYLGQVSEGGKTFKFSHLPVGKYDLVMVDAGRAVYEGIVLGDPSGHPSSVSMENLKKRIDVSDAFFNSHQIDRFGFAPAQAYAFVERLRNRDTLTQAGSAMGNVRRLEIVQLDQAEDDWQLTETRHIYREEEPKNPNATFMKHYYISDLGNVRVIDTIKKLPPISIPTP